MMIDLVESRQRRKYERYHLLLDVHHPIQISIQPLSLDVKPHCVRGTAFTNQPKWFLSTSWVARTTTSIYRATDVTWKGPSQPSAKKYHTRMSMLTFNEYKDGPNVSILVLIPINTYSHSYFCFQITNYERPLNSLIKFVTMAVKQASSTLTVSGMFPLVALQNPANFYYIPLLCRVPPKISALSSYAVPQP
jgi:hypothetical protein